MSSPHSFPRDHQQSDWVIPDPGDAGAIDTRYSGVVNTVTTAAETRTLGRPTYVGQWIMIICKTDGGDCVVTVTGGVNQAGHTTITFAEAGEHIQMRAGYVGTNLVWRANEVMPDTDGPATA